MATLFEQRLGVHVSPLVIAFVGLVVACVLIGAVIRQGIEWSRALKSRNPGTLISVSRSTVFRTVFRLRGLYRLVVVV